MSKRKVTRNLYDIKDDKDTNLLPGNIKKNVKILGVTGELDPQQDESDATATSADIALNKSAYVNNAKIYGSVITTDDGLDTLQTTISDPNITYSQGKINIESPITTNQHILLRQNSQVYVEGSINQGIIANKANITGDKIIEGNTVLGVAGTVENKGDVNISTQEEVDTTIGSGYYNSITSPALIKDSSYRNAQRLAGLILEGVNLPDTYEQLEYLESTGTQYIQLDFPVTGSNITNGNYNFYLDAQFTEFDIRTSGSQYHLEGVGAQIRSGLSKTKMIYVGWLQDSSGSDNHTWCFSNSDKDDVTGLSKADLNRHLFYVSSEIGNENFYIDNTYVASNSVPSTTCKYAYKFGLFGYENDNGIQYNKIRIYRCIVAHDNPAPRVDLVPAKRISDGVVGMYDRINNTFYTNQGTGTFLYKEF